MSSAIALLHRRRAGITGGAASCCHLLTSCRRAGCHLRACATRIISADRSGIGHPGSACAMARGQRSGTPSCSRLSRIAIGSGILHVGVSSGSTRRSCICCRGPWLLTGILSCLLARLLVLKRRRQGGGQDLVVDIVCRLGFRS